MSVREFLLPDLGEGLEDAEVVKLINGPEAFTPDGEFVLGPTEVRSAAPLGVR